MLPLKEISKTNCLVSLCDALLPVKTFCLVNPGFSRNVAHWSSHGFLAKTDQRLHDFPLDTLQLAKDTPTSWLTSIIPSEKMSA